MQFFGPVRMFTLMQEVDLTPSRLACIVWNLESMFPEGRRHFTF